LVLNGQGGFVISFISPLRFTPQSLRRTASAPRSAGFGRLELGLIAKPPTLTSMLFSFRRSTESV